MLSENIDRLDRLVEAGVVARRRLVVIGRMADKFGLRLSELRSLEIACQSADAAIADFHCRPGARISVDHEPAECEIAGIDALHFASSCDSLASRS